MLPLAKAHAAERVPSFPSTRQSSPSFPPTGDLAPEGVIPSAAAPAANGAADAAAAPAAAAPAAAAAAADLVALDPRKRIPFTLVEKEALSHNVRRFRFALQSPQHRFGLPVGKHVFLYAK